MPLTLYLWEREEEGDFYQKDLFKIIRATRKIYSEDEVQEERSIKELLWLDFDRLYSGHHQIIQKDASKILRHYKQFLN